MKELLLSLVQSAAFKRFLVFGVTLACVFLNKKFGLDLQPEQVAGAVILALVFIIQSAMKETVLAKAKLAGEKAVASKPASGLAGVVDEVEAKDVR